LMTVASTLFGIHNPLEFKQLPTGNRPNRVKRS